jgi:hypothetical protein
MAQRGIFFAGKQILIPGAYADYKSLTPTPINVAATNVVAILGKSAGGKPFAPTGIGGGDMDRVQAIFRSGDLVDGAEMAVYPLGRNVEDNPNPGATELILMRVTPATQSTLDLTNNTPATVGTIASLDYGEYTRGHQIGVFAGTKTNTVKVVIQNALLGIKEQEDNLGDVLGIKYSGNGTAKLEISDTSFKVTLTPASSNPDGSTGFEVLWTNSEIKTIQQLAAYIATQPKYTVVLYGAPNMLPKHLDRIASPGTTLNTTEVLVKATVGATADWINRNSRLVKFTLADPLVLNSPLKQIGFTNLASGVDGTESVADWKKAINLLRDQPCYFVVPILTGLDASNEALVRDALIAHVLEMSDIKVKKRRVVFLGHRRGLIVDDVASPGKADVTAVEAIATTLNTSRAVFVSPGLTRKILDVDKDVNSYLIAAAAAGIKAGAPPQRPLTLRKIQAASLEWNFDITAQEKLVKMGASYVVPHKGKFRFGIGQTTWLQDFDPVKSEISLVHIGDTIAATAENELEEKHGAKEFGGPRHLAAFKADFEDILEESRKLGMLVDGNDPVTGEFVPAYRNVKVSFASRRWSASCSATAAEPGNYITIEIGFGSASGSVA